MTPFLLLGCFGLLAAAAGLWYGGRALLARRRAPSWLAEAVDRRRAWLLLALAVPLFCLLALGFSALFFALLG